MSAFIASGYISLIVVGINVHTLWPVYGIAPILYSRRFSPLFSLMAPINRRNFEARVVEPIVRSGEPEYVRRNLITVKRGELGSLIEVLKGFWCCGYVSAGNKNTFDPLKV